MVRVSVRNRHRKSVEQHEFGFLRQRRHGGARRGAGRKPVGARAGVTHHGRAPLASRFPAHVTMRLRRGLPNLRQLRSRNTLFRHLRRGCDRFGFRLIEFSIQSNHIHLVVEATDRRALSRGMQGLGVRIARGLNKLWDRTGSVFADRYHDRILRTPTEVRNALRYVLQNNRKHERRWKRDGADPFSSGPWFTGWRDLVPVLPTSGLALRLAEARTWLLTRGWRCLGLLSISSGPRSG